MDICDRKSENVHYPKSVYYPFKTGHENRLNSTLFLNSRSTERFFQNVLTDSLFVFKKFFSQKPATSEMNLYIFARNTRMFLCEGCMQISLINKKTLWKMPIILY